MTEQPKVIEQSGSFAGNQVVVDTADLRPVLAELKAMEIATQVVDAIPALQVTMISIGDLSGIDARPGSWDVRQNLVAAGAAAGRTTAPSDLDVLMTQLAARFQDKYHRAAEMGKNRDMEIVEGLPQWAAEGLPNPTDPVPLRPRTSVAGPALRVGLLDTAMFPNPVLDGRWLGDDIVTDAPPLPTWAGHASFIVGRILQRAPGAIVEVRGVLEDKFGTATSWAVAKGMASFLGSGVDVLNLSLGCLTADDDAPFLLERAAQRLTAEMVVVAAVGNHGTSPYPMPIPGLDDNGVPLWRPKAMSVSSPMWPAAVDGVVGVGAATASWDGRNQHMTAADFTPVDVPWIALWAPGVDTASTYLTGPATATTWMQEGDKPVPTVWNWDFKGYATWSGTSMAAGDVTGEIAAVAQTAGISARRAYERIVERPGGPDAPDDVRPWVAEREDKEPDPDPW